MIDPQGEQSGAVPARTRATGARGTAGKQRGLTGKMAVAEHMTKNGGLLSRHPTTATSSRRRAGRGTADRRR